MPNFAYIFKIDANFWPINVFKGLCAEWESFRNSIYFEAPVGSVWVPRIALAIGLNNKYPVILVSKINDFPTRYPVLSDWKPLTGPLFPQKCTSINVYVYITDFIKISNLDKLRKAFD